MQGNNNIYLLGHMVVRESELVHLNLCMDLYVAERLDSEHDGHARIITRLNWNAATACQFAFNCANRVYKYCKGHHELVDIAHGLAKQRSTDPSVSGIITRGTTKIDVALSLEWATAEWWRERHFYAARAVGACLAHEPYAAAVGAAYCARRAMGKKSGAEEAWQLAHLLAIIHHIHRPGEGKNFVDIWDPHERD